MVLPISPRPVSLSVDQLQVSGSNAVDDPIAHDFRNDRFVRRRSRLILLISPAHSGNTLEPDLQISGLSTHGTKLTAHIGELLVVHQRPADPHNIVLGF